MCVVNPGAPELPEGMPVLNPGGGALPEGIPLENPGTLELPVGMPAENPGEAELPEDSFGDGGGTLGGSVDAIVLIVFGKQIRGLDDFWSY